MDRLVIHVGQQRDGFVYRLAPESRDRLHARFPARPPRADSVFVGLETRASFEQVHGPMAEPVAALLTGLTAEQMASVGEVVFADPVTDDVLHRIAPQHA
jgi:hypothetical protein